jgi:hypothetical protein
MAIGKGSGIMKACTLKRREANRRNSKGRGIMKACTLKRREANRRNSKGRGIMKACCATRAMNGSLFTANTVEL